MTLDDWRRRGSRFRHRGHAIHYTRGGGGSGPALLCIHGFPTASWDWSKLWPALSTRFGQSIAPDMIGFGFSAKPRGYPYSMFDQADLHERLLAELGVAQVHVLAHDIGDTVAQELLARHAERAGKGLQLLSVTLLNGGLFPETHRPTRAQKLLLGPFGALVGLAMNERRFGENFSSVFGSNTQPSPAELHDFWRLIEHERGQRIMHRLIAYILERRTHRARWVGALQQTRVPLRLIDGLDDPVSGAHMVARYRELIPDPDVIELPGVGHYPQVEASASVLQAFFAFIDRLTAAGI